MRKREKSGNGLINISYLSFFYFQVLNSGFNSGAIFETFVVTEIMKSWIHNGKEPHFYFYRDSNQNEVDLLIHHAGRYWPIEVKSSFAPKRHAKSGIDSFRRTEPNCAMGAVISMTDSIGAFDENTVTHGIWMI